MLTNKKKHDMKNHHSFLFVIKLVLGVVWYFFVHINFKGFNFFYKNCSHKTPLSSIEYLISNHTRAKFYLLSSKSFHDYTRNNEDLSQCIVFFVVVDKSYCIVGVCLLMKRYICLKMLS